MFIKLVRNVTHFILKNFYNLKIIGIERIPAKGGLIVACNHMSNIDPPILEIAINKKRHSRFIVKKELMQVAVLKYIFKEQKYIPIDRKKPGGDLNALRLAINAIKQGDCVVVFPEGTRSKDGSPASAKLGIGFLACKTKASVVCARVFRTNKFPFSKNLVLKIGNMLECGEVKSGKNSKQVYSEFSNKIMSEIISIKEYSAQDM